MKILAEIQNYVNQDDLEQKVKDMYCKVALNPGETYHFEMGRKLAERLGYPTYTLNRLPSAAIDSFAGVGYHFDLADLGKGENVVDLGSGSGMDAFFAASKTGASGEVIGIDMTDEQLNKAEKLRDQHNFNNVHFHKGYIEEIPVATGSIDVVISNGVINLSANKARVFSEVARVLRSGGRLIVSDIVSRKQLPYTIKNNASLWASCIGGAMHINEYYRIIEDAGLNSTLVKKNPYEFLSKGAKGAVRDYGIMSISILAVKK